MAGAGECNGLPSIEPLEASQPRFANCSSDCGAEARLAPPVRACLKESAASGLLEVVLVSYSHCHKSPQTLWLKTIQVSYLTVLEVRSLTSRC